MTLKHNRGLSVKNFTASFLLNFFLVVGRPGSNMIFAEVYSTWETFKEFYKTTSANVGKKSFQKSRSRSIIQSFKQGRKEAC